MRPMNPPKLDSERGPAKGYSGKPQTLVIDDDIVVADTLAMVLNAGGFEATAVTAVKRGSN